jgi:arsenate reductase-like glutaredoxin family protein
MRTSGAPRTPNLWQEAVRAGGAFLSGYLEIGMNIQIFGTLKCQDTKKAQRYFRERRIPFQFVDLTRKGLSQGELNSLKAAVGIDNLIDREGKTYAEKNLKYLIHDIEEEILKDPLLLRTPIVRNGRDATTGYQPDSWKAWK